jgi:hypothetical protein
MPYETGQDLKADVLFRSGEESEGSDWDSKVLDYLNRVYQTLAAGASEFLPEYIEDWWWMRGSDVLTLEPVISTGTVAVTQNSTSITFSSAPASSVTGWRFRIDDYPEVFKISAHTGGQASATLDSAYTGEDNSAATYKLMKVQYSLSASVSVIMSPMVGYRSNPNIIGLSPERMDQLYPLPDLEPGAPRAFALDDDTTVRFSHGGRTDGLSMRVEYRFRRKITDLEDSASSKPLVPIQWRHILADMALTYVLLDKNDDRSNAVALAARTGLAGMLKENRRRMAKIDQDVGHIFPRSSPGANKNDRALRTNSGLIIG